jgi:hypothetical protein
MIKIENAFAWLGWTVCIMIITLLFLLCFMPVKVTGYSLGRDNVGNIAIEKHIEWGEDHIIEIDRSVTLEQTIQYINELNKTIK